MNALQHEQGRERDAAEACEESAFLTPALRAELLASYPDVRAELVADDLMCHLAAHEDGDHFAIVYDHLPGPDAGALWTRWSDDVPRVILLRPDCPARSPEDRIPCGHFAEHPGPHSWQTSGRG
ncbi:hypothetical protein VSR01_20840 [Actinacidiphila sp. DG2A-62]|jgi:hypothetical protein|uniref:hypothetical protein n=1 Tax=Actinacidiphila sp. DG2A-62 TaxID=3108821 RepID=UPI002DB5C681|nr:hypothetical protein [Actinacidiphila sp. DG2A-62]MEC3995831.1 hypothetical protein [Actinacidiphila sp. DG2A-62]